MKNNLPRLIIVTGKGGVGKTTCALALTKYLTEKKVDCTYLTLQMGTLRRDGLTPDYSIIKNLCQRLNISEENLELKSCLTEYIAQKLGSSILADWIVNTKFFSSLVEIIPGFSQLIYMGRILKELKDNPHHHIILDGAASGHALMLIESIYNFHKIFTVGPLHQDMQTLKQLFTQENFVKIVLVTIAQELSMNEYSEFRQHLHEIDSSLSCSLNFNQCFSVSDFPSEYLDKTQYWIHKKLEEEKLNNLITQEMQKIPLIPNIDLYGLILKLSTSVEWERSLI